MQISDRTCFFHKYNVKRIACIVLHVTGFCDFAAGGQPLVLSFTSALSHLEIRWMFALELRNLRIGLTMRKIPKVFTLK